MAEIIMKKKTKATDLLPLAGTIAGGVVGGMAGGPMGAVTGASAGGQLGSVAGGALASNEQPNAIQRRMGGIEIPQASDQNAQLAQLQEARIALASQPVDVQKQYDPTLQAAMLRIRRGQA
jgi:outer membrane lipoprotein SlyB